MITGRKRVAIGNMVSALGGNSAAEPAISEKEVGKPYARIGQLGVERDFARSLGCHSRHRRQKAAKQDRTDLGVRCCCHWRSGLYCRPRVESAGNPRFMDIIARQFLEISWYASRQMASYATRGTSIWAPSDLPAMNLMRLMSVCQEPGTGGKHPEHKTYPDLLKRLAITRLNLVWCTTATTSPCAGAFGMTSNRVGGPPDRQPDEPKAVEKLQEQIFGLCKMARRRLNQPRLDQPLRAARVSRCIIRVIAVWRDGPG